MVLVVAFSLDIQIHTCRIAQTLEEVQEHFGGHVANLLAVEFGVVNQPGAAAEIERNAAQAIVHRQAEAVTLNAALVAQSLQNGLAERNGRILDSVVLIDVQVALNANVKVAARVLANLLKHMVEEA